MLPVVVVRRRPVVVTNCIVCTRPVLWRPLFVSLPPRGRPAWEDGETLQKSEGQAEVVDLNARTYRPGTYSLLDLRDGRQVRYA